MNNNYKLLTFVNCHHVDVFKVVPRGVQVTIIRF